MIYKNILNFVKNRTIELSGLLLISIAILLFISFLYYSPADPTYVLGGEKIKINNLLGIYGGLIADFLLQSFGLSSFLVLITLSIWGVTLIAKKQIPKILLKFFFLVIYLITSCVFIYITFNNSFWLIDNGNSGFVGQMTFNWMQSQLPIINNDYTPFILLVLTFIFFTLASNINYKYLLFNPTRIFKIFKKSEKIETNINNNFDNTSDIINDEKIDKPQQSFLFDKILEPKKPAVKNIEIKNFKLPSVD